MEEERRVLQTLKLEKIEEKTILENQGDEEIFLCSTTPREAITSTEYLKAYGKFARFVRKNFNLGYTPYNQSIDFKVIKDDKIYRANALFPSHYKEGVRPLFISLGGVSHFPWIQVGVNGEEKDIKIMEEIVHSLKVATGLEERFSNLEIRRFHEPNPGEVTGSY